MEQMSLKVAEWFNPIAAANRLHGHAGCSIPPLPEHPPRPLVGRKALNRSAKNFAHDLSSTPRERVLWPNT